MTNFFFFFFLLLLLLAARLVYSYRLDGSGSIPGTARLFSFHSVQTGSGAHPAFYKMGTGGDLPGDKATGA
jgi:hypothetical protein